MSAVPSQSHSPWRVPFSDKTLMPSTKSQEPLSFAVCRYLAWQLWDVTPWRFEDEELCFWQAKIARVPAATIERLLGVWEH